MTPSSGAFGKWRSGVCASAAAFMRLPFLHKINCQSNSPERPGALYLTTPHSNRADTPANANLSAPMLSSVGVRTGPWRVTRRLIAGELDYGPTRETGEWMSALGQKQTCALHSP